MSRKNPRFRRTNPTLPAHTGNLFQITMLGSIENQLTVNTFYYQDDNTALVAGTESDLLQKFRTSTNNVESLFLPCCSSDWTLVSYRVACLTSPSRIPFISIVAAGTVGTGAAGHEPSTVASLLTRYSNIRGQSGRGRLYLPAVPTTVVTASSINATPFIAWQNLAARMTLNLTGVDRAYTPQVVSRRGVAAGGSNYGCSAITSVVARQLLATIRRRRIGRGK
jgi:hypothetical protein